MIGKEHYIYSLIHLDLKKKIQTFFCFELPKLLRIFSSKVRQEQELRNGGTVDKKLSTLADLFRPPIELMHKGSFETVGSHTQDT